MNKTRLSLILPALLLAACTAPPSQPPVVEKPLEIPETLTVCESRPAPPCENLTQSPDNATLVAAPSRWDKITGMFSKPVTGPEKPLETPAAPICTEKDRLRWEALVMKAHADCKGKLDRVRNMLKGQQDAINPPG